MKRTRNAVLTAAAVAVSALAIHTVLRAESHYEKKPVVWAASDLKWADNPAMKGAKIAVLWGDPKTGGYGALKTISAGSKLALHTHSHDQRVIVVSGTVVITIGKGPAKECPVGSYAFLPAGVPHVAECKSGADCTYFEEQQGASDIKFVEAAPAKP